MHAGLIYVVVLRPSRNRYNLGLETYLSLCSIMDHDFTTTLREPKRRPPLSRSSSGSTTHSRATARIANSTSSPKQQPSTRTPNHTMRRYHNHCGDSPANDKPSLRIAGEMTHESRRGNEPRFPSYFQERLQQERKAAGRRPSSRLGGVAGGLGTRDEDTRSTLSRRSETPPNRRPRSDCGEETVSQRELGSKELEKVRVPRDSGAISGMVSKIKTKY